LPVIHKNITILNRQEAVPKIKHNDSVHLKISDDPTINITVVHNPDVVEKPSEYVSKMFHINK